MMPIGLPPATLPAPVVHALLHPELDDAAFAATRFTPATTKAWFARHMMHFLASDCPRHQFTPRFHAQLTRCFNLPTHYGLHAFWTEHFATVRTKARFVEQVQRHPAHGGSNPAWRDVEQEIVRRLRRSGLLAHYRQHAAGEHDAADRAELARLVAKYGRDVPAPDPGILRTVLVPANRSAPSRPARRRDDTGQRTLGLGWHGVPSGMGTTARPGSCGTGAACSATPTRAWSRCSATADAACRRTCSATRADAHPPGAGQPRRFPRRCRASGEGVTPACSCPPRPPAVPYGPCLLQESAMLIQTVPYRLADASCLASARRWRMHAELLRDGAEVPALTTGQRTTLLRNAEAAERQARRWLRAMWVR